MVEQYDLKGGFVKEWKTIVEAANFYKVHKSNIQKCCSGERKTCRGYIWRLKSKEGDKMENIRVRGTKGELIRMRLEDRYDNQGYYSVEIKSGDKDYIYYAVEMSEIQLIR